MFKMSYLTKSLLIISLLFTCLYSQEPLNKVLNAIEKAGQVKLKGWKTDVTVIDASKPDFDDSKWLPVGESFSSEDVTRWFRIKIAIPDRISGHFVADEPVILSLDIDAKCMVYINGEPAGKFDEPKAAKKITLVEKSKPGAAYTIAVKIERAGIISRFFGGFLDIGKFSNYREKINDFSLSLQIAKLMTSDPKDFLMGKKFTINQSVTGLEKLKELKRTLNKSCEKVNVEAFMKGEPEKFCKSILAAEKEMAPISKYAKEHTIYITGNAHIDAAWLWRWVETVDVARYTFLQQLNLIEEYPEYVFSQSSAVYYKWMKEKFPEIFEKIKEKVKKGNWELVGGTIIEPDCNLISGESWARQLLYGMEIFKEYFDVMIALGWNPDSFGYNWNMPQFYKHAGVKFFITQKISWNDMNEFPYHLFWWEGPDGSRILTYFPMSGYVNTLPFNELIKDLKLSEANTGRKDVLVLYGLGDHGGGPERYMIERVIKYRENPFFPKVVFAKAEDYLKNLTEDYLKTIPVWKDELYLEFHRGTFTTQAATKAGNRKSEHLLTNAEKISSFAMLNGDAYPQDELKQAWWKVLFNQFHDILPGSSIAPVYVDAKEFYKEVEAAGKDIIKYSLEYIGKKINTASIKEGKIFIVYNTLSWERSEVCYLELPRELNGKFFKIFDDKKQEVPYQIIKENKKVAFIASGIPSMGYKVFNIIESNVKPTYKENIIINKEIIENEYFKVKVNDKTGNISSIYDKLNNREVLSGEGNKLQIFEDKPRYYDAWEIGYTGKKWELDESRNIQILEFGPILAKIRISKNYLGSVKSRETPTNNFPSSFFTQDIVLYSGIPKIDIMMNADWWEEHALLKTAFPVNIKSNKATYEIPNAAIQRPTTRNNSWEKARYEVPALQWADLSENDYGVSLLNDSKYGYDIEGNLMRLTLLRAPVSPDPKADRGLHNFTYSIFPHKGDWKEAGTVLKGYELNNPMMIQFIEKSEGVLPLSYSMINVSQKNVIISAVKKSESGKNLIIRLYESTGKGGEVKISFAVQPKAAREVNFLEKKTGELKTGPKEVILKFKQYETKTIEVNF